MNKNILSENDIAIVHDILVEQLNVLRSQLTESAKLHEDLGSDSLDDAEIVLTVEERFNVAIPDERVDEVRTVGDLQTLLAELLAEKSSRPACEREPGQSARGLAHSQTPAALPNTAQLTSRR